MLLVKKIILLSMVSAPSSLLAIDYTVSAALANTILGPRGYSFTITAGNPFNLSNGDTLTVDGASLGGAISLTTGQYLIGLAGNNIVTVNSGKNITATFGGGTSGYAFYPTGTAASTIIIGNGASIQTAGPTSALYNPTSSTQSIMVQNFGLINTKTSANLVNSTSNVVAVCGTAPPTITGNLNSGASIGNSSLYLGGYVDAKKIDQLNPTTFTYSNPYVLSPFSYARVMAGSVFNLQADIPTSTVLAYNDWIVDANATLNLQVSTATPAESLTTNNFKNYGSVAFVAGVNSKIITVNNLLNAGLIQIVGVNNKINGYGTSPMIQNNSTGIIQIGSSASATIQNFNLFLNSGNVVSAGTIYNITSIKNNAGGVFTFDSGSIFDTIGTIDNAFNAIMNFNNATCNNNSTLIFTNEGIVNFESGDFGASTVTNSGNMTLTGGTIGKTLALTTSEIDNNAKGVITGTAGQIGAVGQNYVPLFRNYGSINLTGVPIVVTTLTNYGSFLQQSANLTVTNFSNLAGAYFKISNAAAVALGGSISNYGSLKLDTIIAFNSIINNYGSVEVNGAITMLAVNNHQDFTISASTYNANATVFTNNNNLKIDSSTVTMSTLSNVINSFANFSSVNTFNGNINNSGTISLIGTINHVGAYVGDSTSTLVVTGKTNYNGNNTLNQHGTFKSKISSPDVYGELISNQDVSLSGCNIVVDVDQSLADKYNFTILQTTGGHTITTLPNKFNSVNNFLYSLDVKVTSSDIKASYNRVKLSALELSSNSHKIASTMELVYSDGTTSPSDLNELMSSLLNYADSTDDVEEVLQQIAPIPISSSQSLSIQRNIDQQLSERMFSTLVAYNSGQYTDSFSTWMRWVSSTNLQRTVRDYIGYKFDTKGLIIGMEAETDNGSYLGVALALAQSVANKIDKSSSSKTTTWQATAYSQNYWTKKFFTNCLFGMANNDINQIKVVNFGSYNKSSYAHYDWQNFFLKGEAGYVLNVSDIYRLIPKLSMKGIYLKGYSYQEYGGGDGVNLLISASPVYAIDIGVGASFIADLLLFDKVLQPQVNFTVSSNILQTTYVMRSSFISSQPFTNSSIVPKIGSQLGFGFKYILSQEMDLDFSYNIDYYQSFLGRTWQLQAKYNF